MTLNASAFQDVSREQLTDDLLDAMTSWAPTERMSAFKLWQRRALSLIHLQVISVLEAEGPLAMSRLAEAIGVSVASTTGIVQRMEGRRLVERHHADTDRRVVMVALTPVGKHVFRAMEMRRRRGLRKVLDRLSDQELQAFLFGLRALKIARREVAGERDGRATSAAGNVDGPADDDIDNDEVEA